MKRIVSFLAIASAPITAIAGQAMPAYFHADRVFLRPVTAGGAAMTFITDSGGGPSNLLCRSTAQRLHLPLEPLQIDPDAKAELEAEMGKNLVGSRLPSFKSSAQVPANANGDDALLVHDCHDHGVGLQVSMGEGQLGSGWFSGRIWTWNYPAQRLILESSNWKPADNAHRSALGFKHAAAGSRQFHFPRIRVRIDGRDLDLLLDTGATGYPTAAALAAQAEPAPVDGARATSFITTSMLETWRAAHPDWTVVTDADDLFAPRFRARAIRVPAIEIAGWSVGPVWFTERADTNFHDMMSQVMDRQIEGAIGGNALSHFAMTIDYPKATAWFGCAKDCKVTPRPAP